MKLLRITGIVVALAGVAALAVVAVPTVFGQSRAERPFDSRGLAQGKPFDSFDDRFFDSAQDRRGRELPVLAGRGAAIGVRIADGTSGGVVIEEVDPDSPAEKAGLKRSDVIVEFDGERVRSARQFGRLVQETPPGRTVKATVTREGQRKDVQITPTEGRGAAMMIDGDRIREQMGDLAGRFRDFNFNFDFDLPDGMSTRRLGVTVQELTNQLADYFGTKDGVLITAVTDGSAAAHAGLKAGDVITSINSRRVASRTDLVRSLRDADGEDITIGIVRDKKESSVKAKIEPLTRRTTRGRPV
jgi:C-terminal processing protease CtpA/Prc